MFLVLVAGLGIGGYVGYRHLQAMDARVDQFGREVHRIGEQADAAAESAHAADVHATQAADRAQIAAGARAEAEQLQKQAESRQSEAETRQSEAETAAQSARRQATEARDQLAEIRRQREAELNHIQEVLNQVVATRRTASGLVVSLPDSTFKFGFDSAELSQKNRELLSRIAGILLVLKGYGLSVYGYTDDQGGADYNQKLSLRRAESVRDHCLWLDAGDASAREHGPLSDVRNTRIAWRSVERASCRGREHSQSERSDRQGREASSRASGRRHRLERRGASLLCDGPLR